MIVGAGTGNAGTKECLRKLSEEILQALNPKMSPRDINRERYKENMSPEIAEHIEISVDTLGRNRSLGRLGRLLSRFN